MIISHSHRYVYVEVPRTGSSAVSAELRESYDGELVLRKHATYRDFLRLATEDEKTYFAFSGVRNPLDVAVTRYVHIRSDSKRHFTDPTEAAKRNSLASRLERRIFSWVQRNDASFEQFLRRWYVVPYDTWTSLDHHRMDHIIRFESLAEDFADAVRHIGLEPVRPLPVVNATPERDRDFVSYYTPAAIRRAAWVFGPYMERGDTHSRPSGGPCPHPVVEPPPLPGCPRAPGDLLAVLPLLRLRAAPAGWDDADSASREERIADRVPRAGSPARRRGPPSWPRGSRPERDRPGRRPYIRRGARDRRPRMRPRWRSRPPTGSCAG